MLEVAKNISAQHEVIDACGSQENKATLMISLLWKHPWEDIELEMYIKVPANIIYLMPIVKFAHCKCYNVRDLKWNFTKGTLWVKSTF